jgi:NADH-quinone oxidoreductase subunit F
MSNKKNKRINSVAELDRVRKRCVASYNRVNRFVSVCGGTGCRGSGCLAVTEAIKSEIKGNGLAKDIPLRLTGCHGFCERGPLVVIYPQKIFYQSVKPADAQSIVRDTVMEGKVITKLLYKDPVSEKNITHEYEIPFYKKQMQLIFGNNGKIDPENIEDYLAIGGYSALTKAIFQWTPEEIIEEVKKSGLRGRGGGGFLTGKKWESCKKALSSDGIRYVICNADEGDPGAFMDRSLMEGNPHSVIEGMIIGAFAIGSNQGYVYIRREYPLALQTLTKALKQAREYGFLGENILNSGFNFDIGINRGGGAFVCGESTALMASMEGKVGEPRAKYTHTVEKGLWGRPTCLNNVETWANVPIIINKGADWFNTIGTEKSKGTKIFSLVGKVNNTGLVEVPMGITLREVIFDIGGGIQNARKFKAVQTGGPSGGMLPESLLDLPVDFDKLTEVGSMMGSGGMIVMDERNCMVDVAKYFINFLQEESCGKCVPCREGLTQMNYFLEKVTKGEGGLEILAKIERLAGVMCVASLCGLGKSAPNPVLSSLKYFRQEYETHLIDKKCPAGVCKDLITYSVIEDNCNGCWICYRQCPSSAITGAKKEVHHIDPSKCTKCGICMAVCKFDAIAVK